MSNFEDFDAKYLAILRKIDILRSRGVPESDSEMLKARIALRDFLELKKRNSTAIQKVVPRLTGIKTVTLASKQLGQQNSEIKPDIFRNKYTMLGVALGICALLYFYFTNEADKK